MQLGPTVTPETLNLLCLEQNLIFLSVKNLIMFLARCKKLRTKTNFDIVIVEGSKLKTKSDYNKIKKKKLNMLLENNVILAARQKQEHILILSLILILMHRQK